MKIKLSLLYALMLIGSAAPVLAQNLDDNDLREIRRVELKLRRDAQRRLPVLSQVRKQGAACAARGQYGLATSRKYYYAHNGHPQYYTLP